jgi:isopenicillin N synthase-like dioxygenase
MTAGEILDVDLLAFEQGSATARRGVVDGVRRSLGTGFVYTSHDVPEDLIDGAYAMLAEFFALPADPPMATAPDPGHVWAAPHTDINLVTALPRGSGPGLQLLTPAGWADVTAPAGKVIINSGLMLERLTNGLIPAGRHRVVAPDAAPIGDRYSVVQFCHPAPWFVLSPLPTCVSALRPLRYGAIEAGALLERTLWDINLIRPEER